MKKIFIITLLIHNCIWGQQTTKSGTETVNIEIAKYPLDYLTTVVSKQVQAKGHELNKLNKDGVIYATGAASTGVSSNATNGFVNSRNIAFAKAVMRAKIEMLKISGESVTTQKMFSLVNNLKNSEDPDAAIKASIVDKMETLVDKSLDKALVQAGVNELEVEKMNQQKKEKVFEEKYYSYVASLVTSMLKGVIIYKIVEGEVGSNDYQIAVCIKYSIENQNIAAHYKVFGAIDETLNTELIKQLLNLENKNLVPKLGAQILVDSFGNRYIIGFGQNTVQQATTRQSAFENIGYQKARLNAIENIKELLAEDLIGKQSQEEVEKILLYKAGEQDYYSESNFSEMIVAKKSTLKLNTFELKRWKGSHPQNNEVIYGSIVILLKDGITPKLDMKKTQKGNFIESEDL